MTHAYTEGQLVEQPAIALFASLGWQTVSALEEAFGANGALGRETKGDVVLVTRLREALAKLNPSLPPEAVTAANSGRGASGKAGPRQVSSIPVVVHADADDIAFEVGGGGRIHDGGTTGSGERADARHKGSLGKGHAAQVGRAARGCMEFGLRTNN
jgi:hypothetical protein